MRKFVCIFIFVLSIFMSAWCDKVLADMVRPTPRPLSQKELQAKEFLKACKDGNLEEVKKLIAAGADVNGIYVISGRHLLGPDESREELRQTPLCAASEAGQLAIVKELINYEADVNKTSNVGRTPLMSASFGGYDEIVKVLLKAGADVNLVPHFGGVSSYPLRLASRQGHLSTFKILLEAGAKIDEGVMSSAVEGGNIEIVKILIDKDVDITFKDGNGRTLLMPYVTCTNVDIVKLLLAQNKIDVQAIDHHNGGRNALMIASEEGCTDVIPLFLEAGLEVDSVNNSGETPLMGASRGRHYEIIRTLLAAGANVNAEDKVGRTALVDAALSIGMGSTRIPIEKRFSTADLETIKILVAAGADVNKKGPFGMTSLMFMTEYGITKGEASQKNLKEIVQLLLKAGADVNAKDDRGKTAIALAEKAGNKEIIKLLQKAGAKKETFKDKIKKELKGKDKLICLYNKKFNLPQEYKGPNLKLQNRKTGEIFKTGLTYNQMYIDEQWKRVAGGSGITGYGYSSIMYYDEDGCNEYWPIEKKRGAGTEILGYVDITDVPANSYLKYIPETKEVKVLVSEDKYYNNYIKEKIKDIENKEKELQKSIKTGNAKIMTESLEKFKETLNKGIGFYTSWSPEKQQEYNENSKKARERFLEDN